MFKVHCIYCPVCCGTHLLLPHTRVCFVCLQGFRTPEEVATFGRLMSGMADIVVHKYNGSLKVMHISTALAVATE
jgi:hypothetical protein